MIICQSVEFVSESKAADQNVLPNTHLVNVIESPQVLLYI